MIDDLISKSFQSSGEFRRIGLVSTSFLPNDLVGVGAKQIIRRPLRSQNSTLGLPPRNSPAMLAPGFFFARGDCRFGGQLLRRQRRHAPI